MKYDSFDVRRLKAEHTYCLWARYAGMVAIGGYPSLKSVAYAIIENRDLRKLAVVVTSEDRKNIVIRKTEKPFRHTTDQEQLTDRQMNTLLKELTLALSGN